MFTSLSTTFVTAMHAGPWHDGPPAFWPVFPIFWVLVIGTLVWLVVRNTRRNQSAAGGRAGEARLAERFAAGEIDEDEYRSRLGVLRGQ